MEPLVHQKNPTLHKGGIFFGVVVPGFRFSVVGCRLICFYNGGFSNKETN